MNAGPFLSNSWPELATARDRWAAAHARIIDRWRKFLDDDGIIHRHAGSRFRSERTEALSRALALADVITADLADESLPLAHRKATFTLPSRATYFIWKRKGAPLEYPQDMPGWYFKTFPGRSTPGGVLRAAGEAEKWLKPREITISIPPLIHDEPAGADDDDVLHPLPGAVLRTLSKIAKDESDTRPRWVRLCAMIVDIYPEFIKGELEHHTPLSRAKIEQKIAYYYLHVPALIVEAWETMLKGEWPEESCIVED